MKENEPTDFGYSKVSASEKTERVREVFESVAGKYDVMNDLMSFGLHRLWKRFTLQLAAIRPGQTILDLAGGTGDLAYAIRNKMGVEGRVICSDINAEMLTEGRAKIVNKGSIGEIEYVLADAEALPFPDNSFDLITMAFGLRNVTFKERCLASAYAKLKPGGKFIVLEFSKPNAFLQPAYDLYSFSILPRMGQVVANDADSYRYLAESIRMHPDQETLQAMFYSAGFDRCKFINMTGGIVAAHIGYKY